MTILLFLFFFALCKIIIGKVQLRSVFIGNFLKTPLYNASEPAVLSPLLFTVLCIKMSVLHARHFAPSCSVLFSQTVWAFEGWPSIHISIAITLCYYLSGTSVEKITFLFMFRSELSHFMPTFLWLFKQNENVSIQVRSFFCILVEFGCQPENISEVTFFNLALTWRHFTRGSKCDSNHFRLQKQQHLILAFLSLSLSVWHAGVVLASPTA